MPNNMNKSILLKENKILIDDKQNAYYSNKTCLYKNLKKITDLCISGILKNKTANCILKDNKNTEVKELKEGIILFKNFFGNFTNTCHSERKHTNISKNFIIKFENCLINVGNLTFKNEKLIVKEKLIQTSLLKEIKENRTYNEINLEDLYIKQIKYEDNFTRTQELNRIYNIATNSTTISILIILLIIIPIFCKRRATILQISSEPQFNGGGVTISPHRVPI